MTQVEFHTGVADEAAFTCRLLRKAYHQGARVLVRAPAALLHRLDRDLWTVFERDFIPHLRLSSADAPAEQGQRTPIWLAQGDAAELSALPSSYPPVLVNLDAPPPAHWQAFERIIEIVGIEPETAARGRSRWRAYEAAGVKPLHHAGRRAPRDGDADG